MINVRIVLLLFICSHSVVALENQSDSQMRSLVEDFSMVTEAKVESVKEIDISTFNSLLQDAQKENKAWTTNFFEIALRIPELNLNGTTQSISVDIEPYDWGEEDVPLESARITVENGGWLDDSITGERYVIWLRLDSNGLLTAHRILWAGYCDRPEHQFYSADACP